MPSKNLKILSVLILFTPAVLAEPTEVVPAPFDESVVELTEVAPDAFVDESVVELTEVAPDAFVDESVVESAEAAADATVDETVVESTEAAADATVDETVIESTEAVTDATVDESVVEPTEAAADATVDETVIESTEAVTDATVDETVVESTEVAPDATVDESVVESTEAAADATVDETVVESIKAVTDATIDETVVESTEVIQDTPVETDIAESVDVTTDPSTGVAEPTGLIQDTLVKTDIAEFIVPPTDIAEQLKVTLPPVEKTAPSQRFTDNDNGTITDNQTGLIWLKNANCAGSAKNWHQAIIFVTTLGTGAPVCNTEPRSLTDGSSKGDWRMPTLKELQSLIHYGFINPAVPNTSGTDKWVENQPFSGVQMDYYWSSTTYAGSTGNAWGVGFSNGYVNASIKTDSYRVWPVRSGK